MTALEKIKRLEEYIIINNSIVDSVIETTINKLLVREFEKISDIKERLLNDITQFENQYSLKSALFYNKYEKGELGDSIDFVEWASTIEMLNNIEKQYQLLESSIK